jgi:hypothetical protein
MRAPYVLIASSALAAITLAGAAAAQNGPFTYHVIAPCRAVDSRTVNPLEGTNGQPLSNGVHSFRIQGQCGVPNGASAVSATLTVINPSWTGFLAVWAANIAEPATSMCDHQPGVNMSGGTIVALAPVSSSTDMDLKVRNSLTSPGTADLVIDVTGYFQ